MIETPSGARPETPAEIGGAGRDPLRRFERDAGLACVAMAAIALVVRGGQPDVSLGVLGGGLLMLASYRAIRGGVDALLAAVVKAARDVAGGTEHEGPAEGEATGHATGEPAPEAAEEGARRRRGTRARAAWFVLRLAGRYALLAVGAYVMLVRLRLHPVGLILGVTSPVVAAVAEAVRAARAVTRR